MEPRSTTRPPSPAGPVKAIAGVAGAAGGYGLTYYCGAQLLIPAVASAILLAVLVKASARPHPFAGAIAATGGHVAWFAVAGLLLGAWRSVALDVVALTAGVVWLWAAPGVAAAVYLIVVQGLSLALNVYQLIAADVGTLGHKALVVHCLWRVLALAGLAYGLQRRRATPPATA